MAALKSLFQLSLIILIFSSCSHFNTFNQSIVDELIVTPDPKGHQKIIDAILNAKKSVRMKMYHLTNIEVVNALLKAHQKSIDLKIILNSSSLQEPPDYHSVVQLFFIIIS